MSNQNSDEFEPEDLGELVNVPTVDKTLPMPKPLDKSMKIGSKKASLR
jgi:hypothetical protein